MIIRIIISISLTAANESNAPRALQLHLHDGKALLIY